MSESRAVNLSAQSSPLLRHVVQIFLGNAWLTAATLASGILIARWVTPGEMGLWQLAGLVSVYLPWLQLGIPSGLNRDLPYLIGAGRAGEASELAAAALWWMLLLAVVTGGIGAVLVATLPHPNATTIAVVVSATLGAMLTCVSTYYTMTYRTHSEFARLARFSVVVGVVNLASLGLVWRYGFHGLIARAPLIVLTNTVMLHLGRPLRVRPSWNLSHLTTLVRTGLPIAVLGQGWTMFTTLDRLMLARSIQSLGMYVLAIQVSAAAQMIPTAFSTVVYPSMSEVYGRTGDRLAVWRIGAGAALQALAAGAVVAAGGWLLLPVFVHTFLPAYASGIRAAQWASLQGLALGPYVFDNVFNVIRRQYLFAIPLGLGALAFLGGWTALSGMEGPVRASIAMLGGLGTCTFTSAVLTYFLCARPDGDTLLPGSAHQAGPA